MSKNYTIFAKIHNMLGFTELDAKIRAQVLLKIENKNCPLWHEIGQNQIQDLISKTRYTTIYPEIHWNNRIKGGLFLTFSKFTWTSYLISHFLNTLLWKKTVKTEIFLFGVQSEKPLLVLI